MVVRGEMASVLCVVVRSSAWWHHMAWGGWVGLCPNCCRRLKVGISFGTVKEDNFEGGWWGGVGSANFQMTRECEGSTKSEHLSTRTRTEIFKECHSLPPNLCLPRLSRCHGTEKSSCTEYDVLAIQIYTAGERECVCRFRSIGLALEGTKSHRCFPRVARQGAFHADRTRDS